MQKFLKKFFYKQRVQQVADYYDHWSEKFMSITDTFQGFRTEHIEDMHNYTIQSASLAEGDVILDAGCGVGGPAFYFAQKLNIQAHALTNSPEQVRIITARKSKNGVENIFPRLGDYHQLSKIYAPEMFSKILFLESLGHSYNPEKVLKETCSALRSGGSLYIRDLYIRKAAAPEIKKEVDALIKKANETFVYNHTYIDTMLRLIESAGFEIKFYRMPAVLFKSIDHEFEKKLGIAPPKGIQFAEPFEILATKP
ncbi:MAG: methyltransferase domain-containing protein [Chitinophagales bacterium]|nr:methyltransferase domain-containing protein [Chitinophagales bacterium]